MSGWAPAPLPRDQIVLFQARLDEAIAADHPVRLFDEILGRLDWSGFEAGYDLGRGQPPIPPRVVAGILLYGVLTRVRSSRRLEEALRIRLDFRWLVEDRSVDHSTLSEFRRKHHKELKAIFVKLGLIAAQLQVVSFQQLLMDGTRVRASNRRSGSMSPAELKDFKQGLEEKYAVLEAEALEEERLEGARPDSARLPLELTDTKRRLEQVRKAAEEVARLETAGEPLPTRIPLTDPESRISPNKEGGSAPNYTPLACVDGKHGFLLEVDVISGMDEESQLLPLVSAVQQQYGLPGPPPEVLADGLYATGVNTQGLEDLGVTFYSPVPKTLTDPARNPALRDDPTQPVPQEFWPQLPTIVVQPREGEKQKQLEKSAFVYDESSDCYRCPQGKPLSYASTTKDNRKQGPAYRRRYKADPSDCVECPLKHLCLQRDAKAREISRDQYEPSREGLAERMATPEAQDKYARRREHGERPFAMIKEHFGVRRFLLRGLEKVRTEWLWLGMAFNIRLLMKHWPKATPPPDFAMPVPT
jgi:transposase